MERKTIDVKTFAKMYGFGVTRSYELIKQDDFPVFYCGRRILILVYELDQWFAQHKGVRF